MKLHIDVIVFNLLRLLNKIKRHNPGEVLALTQNECKLFAIAPEYWLPLIHNKQITHFSLLSRDQKVKTFEFAKDLTSKQFSVYQTSKGEGILIGVAEASLQKTDTIWFLLNKDGGCSYWNDINTEKDLLARKEFYPLENAIDAASKRITNNYGNYFFNLEYELSNDENCVISVLEHKNIHLFILFASKYYVDLTKSKKILEHKDNVISYALNKENPVERRRLLELLLDESTQLGYLLRKPKNWLHGTSEKRGNFAKVITAYKTFFNEDQFDDALEKAKAGKPLPILIAPRPPEGEPPGVIASAPPFSELEKQLYEYTYNETDLDPYCFLEQREREQGQEELFIDQPAFIKMEDSKDYPNIAQLAKDSNNPENTLEKYIAIACQPLNYREIGLRLSEAAAKKTISLLDDSSEIEKFNKQHSIPIMQLNAATEVAAAITLPPQLTAAHIIKQNLLDQLESMHALTTEVGLFAIEENKDKASSQQEVKPTARVQLMS